MKTALKDRLNVKKAARFVVASNIMQVAALTAVFLYALFRAPIPGRVVEIAAMAVALLLVFWGAVLDIREAMNAGRIADQAQMLEEAYAQLEALNGTLRKQRHDFTNHMQVVYSLLELNDPGEAMRYLESVYGDIRRTGSAAKTAIPAVNALIAAKRQDCEEHGIALDVRVTSMWQSMPVPGWEMCRVLGNLIDNARDALLEDADNGDKRVTLSTGETPQAFTFTVANNGPAIPQSLQRSIFQLGFTTKSDGHGSGLSIVRDILREYGGEIRVESDEGNTAFIGTIPRASGDLSISEQ